MGRGPTETRTHGCNGPSHFSREAEDINNKIFKEEKLNINNEIFKEEEKLKKLVFLYEITDL